MREVTCDQCRGSGTMRRGELTPGIDWSYDFADGFARMGTSQENKDRYRDECVAFLKTIKPGDTVVSSGQFGRKVVNVGMYDGWPFWKPTPAISYIGPLGSIEYDFYYNLSAPWQSVKSRPAADAVDPHVADTGKLTTRDEKSFSDSSLRAEEP